MSAASRHMLMSLWNTLYRFCKIAIGFLYEVVNIRSDSECCAFSGVAPARRGVWSDCLMGVFIWRNGGSKIRYQAKEVASWRSYGVAGKQASEVKQVEPVIQILPVGL